MVTRYGEGHLRGTSAFLQEHRAGRPEFGVCENILGFSGETAFGLGLEEGGVFDCWRCAGCGGAPQGTENSEHSVLSQGT